LSKTEAGIVFVVDDDDQVRRSLERLIGSIGLEVRAFDSAQAFLDHPQVNTPACLVLDVRMPGLSGLDLQQKLNEAGLRLPVIFMSGHGTVPLSVRAMKAGAADFLQKPFDEQEILDAINVALGRDREQRKSAGDRHEIRMRLDTLTPTLTSRPLGRCICPLVPCSGTTFLGRLVSGQDLMQRTVDELQFPAGRRGDPDRR